jgi:hypothetical protein
MVVLAPLRAVIFATTGLTMTASVSQLLQNLPHTTPLRAQRWILGTLAMSAVFWLVALAGVLALANRVHHDIPALLAAKLLS